MSDNVINSPNPLAAQCHDTGIAKPYIITTQLYICGNAKTEIYVVASDETTLKGEANKIIIRLTPEELRHVINAFNRALEA